MKKFLFILTTFFIALSIPTVYAYTYEGYLRITEGTEISSPVTIELDVDNWSDLCATSTKLMPVMESGDNGTHPNQMFYSDGYGSTPRDNVDYWLLTDDTYQQAVFNLPVGTYIEDAVMLCVWEDPEYYTEQEWLETTDGNGDIFYIVSDIPFVENFETDYLPNLTTLFSNAFPNILFVSACLFGLVALITLGKRFIK